MHLFQHFTPIVCLSTWLCDFTLMRDFMAKSYCYRYQCGRYVVIVHGVPHVDRYTRKKCLLKNCWMGRNRLLCTVYVYYDYNSNFAIHRSCTPSYNTVKRYINFDVKSNSVFVFFQMTFHYTQQPRSTTGINSCV